ncbi:hypothetical protein GE061_011243 [Apolygus lucorum]|uniref:Uncharacterized protein n=1 Tax=Apolygus lucorum TaxID=248454 RepID=A0A8S9XX63_APOLU|nr:hypothetical protein GE061_011243 [Apolygus lucorum]
MYVILLSFLCSEGKAKTKPDDAAQEASYTAALTLLSRAFPWSEDEILPKEVHWYSIRSEFKFPNYTWAMGLRGVDLYGRLFRKRYGPNGCMASMIKLNRALTPCSCVFSWYTSYRQFPNNVSMFRPHPKRHLNDITAPYLYVHHTIHDGPSYFVDEKIRHYGIRNDPIWNPYCTTETANDKKKLEVGIVLLELENSVFVNDLPVVMPVNVNTNSPDEILKYANITGSRSLKVVTYGTRFELDNEVIVPEDRENLVGKRLKMQEELISFRIKMVRGPDRSATQNCDANRFNFSISGQECWKQYHSLPLCNILPGSPVVSYDGASMYGIIMNGLRCSVDPDYLSGPVPPGLFQVRRFWSALHKDDKVPLLTDRLVDLYESAIKRRDGKKAKSEEAQPLYNFKSGFINYEDDFPAHLLKTVKPHSSGVRISSLSGIALTVLFRIPNLLVK